MTDVQIQEEQQMWTCPRCRLINSGTMVLCATCEFIRVDEAGADVPFSPELEMETPPLTPSVQVLPAPRALMLPSHENLGAIPLMNNTGVCFRVWAPNAAAVYVIGEFAETWKDWRDYALLPESEVVMAASDTKNGDADADADADGGDGGDAHSSSVVVGGGGAGAGAGAGGHGGAAGLRGNSSYSDLLTAQKASSTPGYFSGVVTAARPGQLYKYVILTDDGRVLWRNDPAARELITSDRGVRNSRVTDRWGFGWTTQNFKPAPLNEAVLYELHIGSFTEEGTYRAAAAKMDHVVALGASAIELMPVSQDAHSSCWGDMKEGCASSGCCSRACWGYDVLSLFSVHNAYGSADDLKALIDTAHAKGLAVVVDWVPNHLSSLSFLNHFDGSASPLGTEGDTDQAGPYLYPDGRRTTPYGPRMDLRSPHVKQYVLASALTLLDEFKVDGLRVDSTQTLRRRNASHGSPDLSEDLLEAWSLMQELTEAVRSRWGTSKYLICEDMSNDAKMTTVAGFDADWDMSYFTALYRAVVTLQDNNRDLYAVKHAIEGTPRRVIFTETHDTVPTDRSHRLPEAIQPGGGPYAVKRTLIAAVVMLTSPGVPMLCAGQELLELRGLSWPKAMPFPLKSEDRPPGADGVFAVFSQLTRLRRNVGGCSAGLTAANVQVTHVNMHHRVIVWRRWDKGGPGDDVVIVANFCAHHFEAGYQVGVPRAGRWHVRLNTGVHPLNADASQVSEEAAFSNMGLVLNVTADMEVRDELPAALTIPLGPYSAVILSQDPPSSTQIPEPLPGASMPGWASSM